jgi:hypothetical protein
MFRRRVASPVGDVRKEWLALRNVNKDNGYVSNDDRFSKGGFHPLLRLPSPDLGIDAVAYANRAHLVICVTGVVDGRREVVGVEVQPLPKGFRLDEWMSAPGAIRQRLSRTLETFAEFDSDSMRPTSAALLRGIPLTAILDFRQDEVARRQHIARLYKSRGVDSSIGRNEISADDEARLAYLDDALLYVAALRERAKPADVIAQARSISPRTAEGRVAKARALGLLTKAKGRSASGELTEDGQRLHEWRERISSRDGGPNNG